MPADWLKPKSEAARFEAFRALPQADKLELLAYCVALTLQPKLGPADGDEATAYDAALSLTGGERGRLLASDQGQLPEPHHPRPVAGARPRHARRSLGAVAQQATRKRRWSISSTGPSPIPDKHGRTPEQVEKLKSWLPAGMAFGHRSDAETGQGQESQEGRITTTGAGGNARPLLKGISL